MTSTEAAGPAVGKWDWVQVDCADPVRLAEFWAAAIGVTVRGQLGDGPQYVFLNPTSEAAPRLCFQRVAEPKTVKNRLHIDLHVADVDSATEALTALGATPVPDGDVAEFGIRWRVFHDPEGNEFCAVQDPPEEASG